MKKTCFFYYIKKCFFFYISSQVIIKKYTWFNNDYATICNTSYLFIMTSACTNEIFSTKIYCGDHAQIKTHTYTDIHLRWAPRRSSSLRGWKRVAGADTRENRGSADANLLRLPLRCVSLYLSLTLSSQVSPANIKVATSLLPLFSTAVAQNSAKYETIVHAAILNLYYIACGWKFGRSRGKFISLLFFSSNSRLHCSDSVCEFKRKQRAYFSCLHILRKDMEPWW